MSAQNPTDARAAAHRALALAQAEFPRVARSKIVQVRTKTGGTYTFGYAPLEAIQDAVFPPLHKHGFAVIQPFDGNNILTQLCHADGYTFSSCCPLTFPEGASAQEMGSLITYMRRYALVSMLGLATEDDDDGNHASGHTASAAVPPSSQQPKNGAPSPPVEPQRAGAPGAAPSPPEYIQKAQEAQAEHKPARPDLPVFDEQTGRWSAVTFVSSVDGPNERGFYDIHVVLDGEPVSLGTKKSELAKTAHELIQSSCRVEWVEKVNGRFTNRYLHSIDAAAESEALFATAGSMPADSIPF